MIRDFPYNEYKFLVTQENLELVKEILDATAGGSDPYSSGVVDSIYYDTPSRYCFNQCLNGDGDKVKFRIRGYGDGRYHQLHLKQKNIFGVGKLKCPIEPLSLCEDVAPDWFELRPLRSGDPVFMNILSVADTLGPLMPSLRVRYQRARYRVNDYRLTLDYRIEIQSFGNGLDCAGEFVILENNVLEVKTPDTRPFLPLFGAIKLPHVSFSKYFLGGAALAVDEV